MDSQFAGSQPDTQPSSKARGGQVARTGVITGLQANIRQLDEGHSLAKLIVNLYGITGIGKTQLIDQFWNQLKQEYTSVFVSFGREDALDEAGQIAPWSTLIDLLRTHIPALKNLPSDITFTSGETRSSATLNVNFTATRLDQTTKSPLLLIFDSLDGLPYWRWVQEHIIKPLIIQQQALVICTSQAPIFWHFWELRENCDPQEVPAFSFEETRQFLRLFGQEILVQMVYDLTLGYPLGLHQAVQLIAQGGDYKARSAQRPLVMEHLSPAVREVLRYTGLLRRVEVPVMCEILALALSHWSDIPSLLAQQRLFTILSELRARGCFESLRKDQPLRFIAEVRMATDATLRSTEPELYERTCAWLAALYARRAQEQPVTDQSAFNEWLYFSAARYEIAPSPAALSAWNEQMRQVFDRARLAGPQLAVALYRDVELVQRLNATDMLPALSRLLASHPETGAIIPALLSPADVRPYLHDYRRAMLLQLSERLPLHKLPARIGDRFTDVLQCIADIDDEFNVSTLLQKLGETQPGPVNEAMVLLNSWSFLVYDRARRTFRLQPLIQHLLSDATRLINEPVRSSTDQPRSYPASF
ncbi:MAG: hypothetical protein MI924_08095 [Chloroflexales bacterium]|nr:hypothetical protein [Chloroflexales bacterium]